MATTSRSLVEVGISMVLQDGFTSQAGKISSSYNSLMNDMNQWNRALTNSAGSAFDYGTKLVGGMYEAYKHSAAVSNQVFLTSKIAGADAKQAQMLLETIQDVNMQTPLTNLDIASGAKYLAMAGNSAEAIQSMVGPAAKLASIFDMQLGGKGGVADMMTNIMATFGIASKDASRVADILGVATTSANISLTDLAQSLQYSGATFRNAGIDLTTAAAAIGVLGDQGIQASSAGTALANMMRYLTLSITGQKVKGAKFLQALGITKDDMVDANGNLRDMGTLMKVLATHMQNLSGTERESTMYNIFGVRGQRAASALFQALWNGSDKMQKIIDKENASAGWVDKVTNERLDTPQGRLDAFNASIDNLKRALGETMTVLTPIITKLTEGANWVAKMVSNKGIGAFVVKLTASTILVTTIVNGVRLLVGTWRMVTTMAGMYTSKTAAAATGMGAMNTQANMLALQLQRIVALMAEYVALSYAPGTRGMMLPGGGRLGRNKAGKPYVGYGGKTLSTATYAGMGAIGAMAAGTTAGKVAQGGKAAMGLSKLAGAGRLGFSLLGGWWGIGLTALMVGIDYLSNSVDNNTNAVNENTQQMSAQEIQEAYNERYIKAIENVIKQGGNNSNSLNLTINGTNVGTVRDGDSVPIDNYFLSY